MSFKIFLTKENEIKFSIKMHYENYFHQNEIIVVLKYEISYWEILY